MNNDWIPLLDGNQDYCLATPEEAAKMKRRFDSLDPITKQVIEDAFANQELDAIMRKCING